MTKVFIAVPAYGGWTRNGCVESLMGLVWVLKEKGIGVDFQLTDRPDIESIRNFYGTLMLENDCSHLLFVDYDMQFDPLLSLRLLAANKPVIGCVYATKAEKPRPVVWTKEALAPPMCKVLGVGMGLTLIEKRCFVELAATGKLRTHQISAFVNAGLKARPIGFFDKRLIDGHLGGEDYSFCANWRELCGGDVWALVGENIGHVGDFTYRLDGAPPGA